MIMGMNGYAVAAAFVVLALFGWRAWVLLRFETPMLRAIGTVLSALAPFPVFLIVIVYHYAKRSAIRPSVSQ